MFRFHGHHLLIPVKIRPDKPGAEGDIRKQDDLDFFVRLGILFSAVFAVTVFVLWLRH